MNYCKPKVSLDSQGYLSVLPLKLGWIGGRLEDAYSAV